MPACTLVLPLLIGIVATIILLNILYEPYIKQKFSDLGALIQLQTSRPVYYPIGWMPVDNNKTVEPNPSQGPITNTDSPLSTVSGPVYNYYPQTPLNPTPTNKHVIVNNPNANLAYANPEQVYDAHKAYYWSMSGGYPYPYPYPFPLAVYSAVDMDKVRAVEDKI
jgi:hypothetical protein